jgi:uncharacterized protein (TIGR03067 family)
MFSLATARAEKESAEVGTWKGKNDEGEATELTFKTDGQFILNIAGFERKGKYKIDLAARPAALDIEFEEDGKKFRVETIIEIQKDGRMRFQNQKAGAKRPHAFDGKHAFILTKS